MPLLVQLTDPHLFVDPRACLKRVPTRETFRAVMGLVRGRAAAADRVYVTGDIAHDHARGSYEVLREMLDEFEPRARVLAGNHDDPAVLRQVFGTRAAPLADAVEGWRIVALDSHLAGEAHGEVGGPQLDWLSSELARAPATPTILFVHHPPAAQGSPARDGIHLRDGDRLAQVLRRAEQVRALFHGHTHRDSHFVLGTTQVYGTPSTAFQFDASETGAFDSQPPGFRVIELGDDLTTRVYRCPILDHPPARDPVEP